MIFVTRLYARLKLLEKLIQLTKGGGRPVRFLIGSLTLLTESGRASHQAYYSCMLPLVRIMPPEQPIAPPETGEITQLATPLSRAERLSPIADLVTHANIFEPQLLSVR
jgi:hypothetical protein